LSQQLRQQRLEGPDLEELLSKVRSDFGQAATIVEANRLRKGGLGGFFAKETYEVVLDVDPDLAAARELEDLDAHADAQADAQADDEFVPFTLEELATRIDDPVPDFTAAMAAAVEEVEAELDDAWPAQQAIADVEPVVAASPKVARLVAGGLDGIPTPALPALPAVQPMPVIAPMPATAVPEPDVSVGLAHTRADADLAALAALGVPVDRLALPYRTDEPAVVALVRLLERLPAPPPMPTAQGAIVAIIGERAGALHVAGQLGLDGEVVLASRRRGADVRTIDDAEERKRAWRRRRKPTFVVIDVPFGVVRDPWAADLLGMLEPVVAIGHVDAGRKPEDVRAWAKGIGGLDALSLGGLEHTTTPAAALAVGLPVALLDGAAATPARWAALLTDRMAALAAA